MKQENNIFSNYEAKKPADDLKQRVLNAATGAAEEPVVYRPFFGKLDWGLLAASLILMAMLVFVSPGRRHTSSDVDTSREELSVNERAMLEELEVPGAAYRKVEPKKINTEQFIKEIGG
jgi:hypothetical protein